MGDFAVRGNGVFLACGFMTRRRISSMPAGTVIAALALIGLVALAGLFLFGESPEVGAPTVPPAAESGQLPPWNFFRRAFD